MAASILFVARNDARDTEAHTELLSENCLDLPKNWKNEKGEKSYMIEGVFAQAEQPNRNGRVLL